MGIVNEWGPLVLIWMTPSNESETGWKRGRGLSLELVHLLPSSLSDARLPTSGTSMPVLFLASRLGSVAISLELRHS